MPTVGSLIISESNGLYVKIMSKDMTASDNPDGLKQIDAVGYLSELIPNYDGRFLIQLVKSKALKVYDMDKNMYIFEESLPGLLTAFFSPQSHYIFTWQTNNNSKNQHTNENNKNIPFTNMKIFKLAIDKDKNIITNISMCKEFPLSYRFNRLDWSNDEKLVMYIDRESLNFFEDQEFNNSPKISNIPGLRNASLSPINNLVVVHIFDENRNINLARLFHYQNFAANASIASVVLPIDAKNVEFKWNPIGTAVIVVAEVESPGKSYYDERMLYFLTIKGDSINLILKPETHSGFYAIHDIAWSPNGKHFVVIHGSLPAETYLFDLRCAIVFKFPKATRNILYFNPFGNILCTTAHGNAHGDVEMWNMESFKLISRFPVRTKTKCVWFPDGKHIIFAVTSPTLRVNNGYEIWNFMAEKIDSYTYESPIEMFDVFPVKNNTTNIYKPDIPLLNNPIDLISSNAPKVYVPKTSKKYLEDDLNNIGFVKRQVKSSYYGKNNVNKTNHQSNPFFNHKNEMSLSAVTSQQNNETTTRMNEFKSKLKNLNKKMNDIQKLKNRILSEGYTPNPDQLLKLDNEPFILEEKMRIENILNENSRI